MSEAAILNVNNSKSGAPPIGPASFDDTPPSNFHPWNVEYYSKYFDVDSSDVLKRSLSAVFPIQSFYDLIGDTPDLYGEKTVQVKKIPKFY